MATTANAFSDDSLPRVQRAVHRSEADDTPLRNRQRSPDLTDRSVIAPRTGDQGITPLSVSDVEKAVNGLSRRSSERVPVRRFELVEDLAFGRTAKAVPLQWDDVAQDWTRLEEEVVLYGAGHGVLHAAKSHVIGLPILGFGYVAASNSHYGELQGEIEPFSVYEVDYGRESSSWIAIKVPGKFPWARKDFCFTGNVDRSEDRFLAPISFTLPVWVRYSGVVRPGDLVGPVPGSTAVVANPSYVDNRLVDAEIVVSLPNADITGPDPENPEAPDRSLLISDQKATYAIPDAFPPFSPLNPQAFNIPVVPIVDEREGPLYVWDEIDPSTGAAFHERVWRYVKKVRNEPYDETMIYGWRAVAVNESEGLVLIMDAHSRPFRQVDLTDVFI